MTELGDEEKAEVVRLILAGMVDEALRVVCSAYGRSPPKVRVGHVKGRSRALAVYVASRQTIFVSSGELLRDPFVMLHELYHHLRMVAGRHRGTEGHADAFARSFIEAYMRLKRGDETRGSH